MKQPSPEPLSGHHKYEKLSELGSGSFGVVQLARNRQTGDQVAIKFLPRGPHDITKHVAREILAHSSFCHPHVVQFREVFLTPSHLGIALEYVPGGDLFQYVRDKGYLSENEARRLMQQLVVALDYCHQMGVVNRDIKLENTLLDSAKRLIKITDFGYAKSSQDSLPISNCGTPNYAAPEVISESRQRYDGTKADVWSCGVMLFVLLFHSYPFERPGDPPGPRGFAKVLDRTMRVDYVFPRKPLVSEACKDFIARLLVADPNKRLSIQDIYRHPWFSTGFPPQAADLNAECLRMRPPPAEHERFQREIKRIVREAMTLPGETNSATSRDIFDDNTNLDEAISDAMHTDAAAAR